MGAMGLVCCTVLRERDDLDGFVTKRILELRIWHAAYYRRVGGCINRDWCLSSSPKQWQSFNIRKWSVEE